jgi:hypothetical protein
MQSLRYFKILSYSQVEIRATSPTTLLISDDKMPDSDIQVDDKTSSQNARGQTPQATNPVEICHVTKSFGYKVALKDVSFFCTCGPNLWTFGPERCWENDPVPTSDGDTQGN